MTTQPFGGFVRRAAECFGVRESELQPFDVEDPFNGNRLEGLLCRRGDRRYGALYIARVNGAPAPQVVYATPKIPYPFDRNGMFRWPDGVRRVVAYEKLDGTNVFAYRYIDRDWRRYVTYKTRLQPVLGNRRFGPFLDYWRDVLARHPEIPAAVEEYCGLGGFGLSFELYGALNRHLILYDEPLATRLLFGVRWLDDPEALVEPPDAVGLLGHLWPRRREVRDATELTRLYRELQAEADAGLERDDGLGAYRGAEGWVWYVETAGAWHPVKCKPATIEEIHWRSSALCRNAVVATAWNVLETDDVCSPERVRELLLEEYGDAEIAAAWPLVLRVSAEVNAEAERRARLRRLVRELGLDFGADPTGTMRGLAPHFQRSEARWVYATLARGFA